MTHNDTRRVTIEGLEKLIDTYGADRSRWPARERLRTTALIAENAEARRLLSEADALDSLLDRAPEPSPAQVAALEARIMAAAVGGAGQAGRVVPMRPKTTRPRRPAEDYSLGWPAASLLAACMVLGVFVGRAGLVDGPVRSLASIVAPGPASEPEPETEDDASQLALGEDQGLFDMEDLL